MLDAGAHVVARVRVEAPARTAAELAALEFLLRRAAQASGARLTRAGGRWRLTGHAAGDYKNLAQVGQAILSIPIPGEPER